MLTADVILELCREAEIKCDELCIENLLPTHVRSTTEHHSKLFQVSPYSVAIKLLSLTSLMMRKTRVEMKDIKLK